MRLRRGKITKRKRFVIQVLSTVGISKLFIPHKQDSDGEKSDQELVVDVANEDPVGPPNGNSSPRENGNDKQVKKEHSSHSPHSSISSNSSTPSSKHKEVSIRYNLLEPFIQIKFYRLFI